jgi:hypothetical protein
LIVVAMVAATVATAASSITKTTMTLQSRFRLLQNLKELEGWVAQERSRLSAAPILLITNGKTEQHKSKKGSHANVSSYREAAIHKLSRQVDLVLSHKYGLRTVPVTCGITPSHSNPTGYTTQSDVNTMVDIARRVGATRVCAVGTGVAMDCAKAVAAATSDNRSVQNGKGVMEDLLLVPATLGAVMASSSSHALLMDAQEETWVPYPQGDNRRRDNSLTLDHEQKGDNNTQAHHIPRTIVLPSSATIYGKPTNADASTQSQQEQWNDIRMAQWACFSILIDAVCSNKRSHDSSTSSSLSLYQSLVASMNTTNNTLKQSSASDSSNENTVIDLVQLLQQTGEHHLSWGIGADSQRRRSIALALAATILPRLDLFPADQSVHFMSFLASLAPSLLDHWSEQMPPDTNMQLPLPSLEQFTQLQFPSLRKDEPTLSVDELCQLVSTNQIVWNCRGTPMQDIRSILEHYTECSSTR